MSAAPAVTLFVTGDAPRSRRARANLAAMREHLPAGAAAPDEVDLLEHPAVAVQYGIFATPALVIHTAEGEQHVMYGDLSEREQLMRFLVGAGPLAESG